MLPVRMELLPSVSYDLELSVVHTKNALSNYLKALSLTFVLYGSRETSSNQNYSNSERKQNAFLACSWRFLRSSTLEHIGKNGI